MAAHSSEIVRKPLNKDIYASIQDGQVLFIECKLPRTDGAQSSFLAKLVQNTATVDRLCGSSGAAIPFFELNVALKKMVLNAFFPGDTVDGQGWRHTVVFAGDKGQESWASIAAWFTGTVDNEDALKDHPLNEGVRLAAGDQVTVPLRLLSPAFRPEHLEALPVQEEPQPGERKGRIPLKRAPRDKEEPKAMETAAEAAAKDVQSLSEAIEPLRAQSPPPAFAGELEYDKDANGPVAIYRLKPGEALYSSVVVRFTDFQENADIHQAIGVIAGRTHLADANKVEAGQEIRIPLEMLADEYHPSGSEQRQKYELVAKEAEQLKGQRSRSRGLEGVVIILDPGHGGRDNGASHPPSGLYEDELTYDMACRIKHLLESGTKAKVYITVEDPDQGFNPTEASKFKPHGGEFLLTTPRYENNDAKISANLRWYLANEIYRKELKAGTKPDNMLFASIHCDSLFNHTMHGAMVYVPGADYRRDREQPSGAVYASYQEVRTQPTVTTDAKARRRDEALSRNFANTLLQTMKQHSHRLDVHDAGNPIRNVIRQSGGKAYVPAVLRNTMVPTKVLVETANLTNANDRKNLSDPVWRQAFAEAFVKAVMRQFE